MKMNWKFFISKLRFKNDLELNEIFLDLERLELG